MKQGGRNIGSLFLLLAGLVILLHSIIPHHHDSDVHFETKSSECNSHNKTDNSETHCHAFNNVVAEKVSLQSYNLQAVLTFILVSIPDFTIITIQYKVIISAFYSYNIIPSEQFFTTKLSFRGPPVLA